MADRFWRGLATDVWDGTAGTKWADTVGGAGGAAVPTAADDVFFDGTSLTCTISGSRVAKSINCTGYTATLAGTATPALTISGSLTLVAGMTLTYAGTTTFNATGTLTSAGKTLGSVTISGSGITVTLGDALNIGSNTLTVTQGTFTTSASNYSVTAGALSSSNANTRTISLNGSTVTLQGSVPISISVQTNLTFNAGTSVIVCTTSSAFCDIVIQTGLTFNNFSFTGTGAIVSVILGANIFNNLTVTGPASAGVRTISFRSRQTINGTLSTTGTAGNRRVWFRGDLYGIAQTLTINSAPSLTDADFRDIYVIGTAAPISGTRIGDLRGCRGITFDTPKSVYWNLAAGGNWSANAWAASSGGGVSTDNFPLAQDTAVIGNTGLNTSATVTLDSALPSLGTIDMSTRTNAMTLAGSTAYTVYGDWKFGSSVTRTYSSSLTFSGRNTQTITSAGKAFAQDLIIDTYGGSVELADALNTGTGALTVTNGTFDTKNYNVTASSLSSNNSNVRTITLGSSTFTLSGTVGISFNTSTNLTFNAGTSNIVLPQDPNLSITCGLPLTFYNITANAAASSVSNRSVAFTNVGTIANLTLRAPGVDGTNLINFTGDATITGTFQVVGTSLRNRYAIRNVNPHITNNRCNLSVNTLLADNCDFEGINLTGAAINTAPSNAGDCGNNAGIVFPASKTLYWNLAGTQTFFSTGWATSSGGTPNVNNFPLAQDTAVFDDAGSAGTVSTSAVFRLGTLEMGSRTTAMTLTVSITFNIFKNLRFGSGVTITSNSNTINISSYDATNYIKTNGVSIPIPVQINSIRANIELEDAFTSGVLFRVLYGQFNAKTYNVTIGAFQASGDTSLVVRMGSGTWTLTYSSQETNVWRISGITFYKDTADIVLSSTSTNSRQFAGESFSYNKLTIGGATGISTTTITGNNQFTELASTKTVAHTIALGSTIQIFGKWTVTGTAGNVVTLTGTGTSHILAGACTSGIDYLAMGSIGFAATSPGEFYAGANSTGTAAAPVYRTAKPADSTRYWVGGTGNWSDTARWSTTSGTGSGASVPRSHDDVVFDSGSNGTAYTATVNAVTGGIRMKALTIAGPASGNVTLAGSTAMDGIHGNVTLPATGLTRTYTGAMTLSSNSTGLTFTTNGVALASSITVNGVDCSWSLGSALDTGASNGITVTNGTFSFANYNYTGLSISSSSANSRTIDFGAGTATLSGSTPINFGTTETSRANLTVTAGTSQINISAIGPNFSGNNQTFYNVSFTQTNPVDRTINGTNSFNNLSFSGLTASGCRPVILSANQTVTGTLTFSAGTNATMRHFCRSDTIGTTRTITANALSMTDVDFRDITIAGAAAPASGTRIGDCKGNSGITFTAAAHKYWNLAAGGNWSATGWALNSGDAPAVNNFPLAQDTCFFEATGLNSGATVTINQSYNIGTIDMSARTTNTMTLATGSTTPAIYGNWVNGTGTTLTGTGTITFAGRGGQTITNAGRTFTQGFTINSPSGSVTLQDAFVTSTGANLTLSAGTLDANTYNFTTTSGSNFDSTSQNIRTLAFGSGTWTFAGSGAVFTATPTNLTVTGTGTISLTSASAKTFAGGDIAYTNITLNQGGNGTLTISGNNTFKTISSTAAGANTIAMGTTTQRITTSWTASGTAGNILTVQGTSASSPGTLVFTGGGQAASVDYLTITGVRAYNLDSTWYAGANSTNNGSLGWIFAAPGGTTFNVSFSDTATGSDAAATTLTLNASVSDTATASDTILGGLLYSCDFSDTVTASDSIAGSLIYTRDIFESATGADALAAIAVFSAAIAETSTGSDAVAVAASTFGALVSELAAGQDTAVALLTAPAAVFESATGADTASAVLVMQGLFSDTVTASDVPAVAASTFNPSFSDTATGSDALSAASIFPVAFSDTATGSDALSAQMVFATAVSELASGLDAFAVAASIFNPSVSELATGQDTPAVAASTFGVSLSDAATLSDAPAASLVLPASFSDTATAADALAAQMIFATAVSELATGTDALSALVIFVSSVSETASVLDTPSVAASIFNVSLSELASGLDAVDAAGSIFNVSFSASGTIADLVVGGYLWNPIDDSQSPNWQNVQNAQAPGWVEVNSTQSPGWQNVVTTQVPNWTDINDFQNPGWVQIQT